MKPDALVALEQAPWPVLLVDGAGTVADANKLGRTLFGPALAAHQSQFLSIWSPDNSGTYQEFFVHAERSPTLLPLKLLTENGFALSYLASVCAASGDQQRLTVLQLLPPNAATTEPKAAEVDPALFHKQKLDVALQLARTVSLDFNNALTSILGHVSLILGKLESTNPWRNALLEIEKSAGRAAEISHDLAAFSRQEKEAPPQTARNLNPVLERCVEFFQKTPGHESVTWAMQLERNPFAARFDELKIQQVFIRIIENSVQSFRGGQGRIAVITRNVELSAPTQDRNVRLAPGAYVSAEISDNGCGIEADALPRIFEPFFTTKRDKKHRGLGLAWVYGIVTNLGGSVAVSSQPGTGTSVRVYLPAEQHAMKDTAALSGDLTGTQTILMVDDEDLVLTMGETILSSYGYRVLRANSGQKALDIISQNGTSIDLVLTDLVMPGMSGRELIEHLQVLAPSIRVLCASGYVWPAQHVHQRPYLQKPFTARELLVKVKQTLTD